MALQGSLELDAHHTMLDGGYMVHVDDDEQVLSSSTSSAETLTDTTSKLVKSYWEMWDYQGGCRFRGFVAEGEEETSMFVFFDEGAFGHGLKAGMMAIIDLCDATGVNCNSIYVCLDRRLKSSEYTTLMKDLRWVGFESTTLADWTAYEEITSSRWTFLKLEID